jgi:hypothetical protein
VWSSQSVSVNSITVLCRRANEEPPGHEVAKSFDSGLGRSLNLDGSPAVFLVGKATLGA